MSHIYQKLWQDMVRRSFSPEQWFEDGQAPQPLPQLLRDEVETIMWVYRKTEAGYEVGFWDPNKQWNVDDIYSNKALAVQRVHYLNGGGL